MDFSELKVAVANRCGIASTDSYYAKIGDRINEALHSIETYAGGVWDWLLAEGTVSTVANQDYLAFSTIASALSATGGIRQIRSVEMQNGSGFYDQMDRRSKRQMRDTFQGVAATSVVVGWAAEGQRLWLFPTPSTVLTLRVNVLKMEPDLSADADEPLLPAIYHRVLVSAAAGLVLRSLQRADEAKIEEDAAAQALSRIPGAANPAGGPGYVRRDGRW